MSLRIIRLIFNRANGALTADSLDNLTRRDGYLIHLYVVNGTAPEMLPGGRIISLAVKQRGEDDPLASTALFVDPAELGRPYVGTLVLHSDAMTTAFEDIEGLNLEEGQEREEVDARLELEVSLEGTYPTTAQKLDIEISNDFVRGIALPEPPDPENPFALFDARYVRYDAAQALTLVQKWQVMKNLWGDYNADGSGIDIELEDGTPARIPVVARA